MSKIRILGLALFVVFALSAVAAASAFAESEFLFEGNAITAPLAVDATGELELSATLLGITAKVDCSGLFEGTVEGKLALVTDAYDLSVHQTIAGTLEEGDTNKTPISCTALQGCNTGELASVWVDNLNLELGTTWDLNILLDAGAEFLIDFPETAGFEVECKTAFGTVEVLCGGVVTGLLTNETGGVLVTFSGAEELTCTKGATKGKVKGEGLIEHVEGTLSVS